MGKKIDWDRVLPGEINWDKVLPNHQWTPYGERTWEHVMPPPRKQLSELLPENFEGSCGVHSFSEALTGLLRIGFLTPAVAVDLPRLLHLTAAKGFLTEEGSTMGWLDQIAQSYGIPLEDGIPLNLKDHPNCKLDDVRGDVFALNTSIHSLPAKPMPFRKRSRTAEVAKEVIKYREWLCRLLDFGPLVICFKVDRRYGKAREAGQPFCRLKNSWKSFADPPIGHCVTAYGYRCPGGDVRTLRILYQENMTGAPTDHPGRLLIHPDAIDYCHVPRLNKDFKLSNAPTQGYRNVELIHPPKKLSWWKKAIKKVF